MLNTSLAKRLCDSVITKKSHIVVGLDPVITRLPHYLLEESINLLGKTPAGAAHAFYTFNKLVIDAVYDFVPAVKPQLAYYEVFGSHGIDAFWKTVEYARSKGLLVVADAKRGDISSTADAYAEAFLDRNPAHDNWKNKDHWVDALTINPYMGSDTIAPFVTSCLDNNTGLFILLKTSNPGAAELQGLLVHNEQTVSDQVSSMILSFQDKELKQGSYSSIGAVVGASYPQDLAAFRKKQPHSIFLVPGYGAQGGTEKDLHHAFNEDGLGALINASRSIIYSYPALETITEQEVVSSIVRAVHEMNDDINTSLKNEKKCAW